MPPSSLDALEVAARLLLHLPRQRLDEVAAAQRIDGVGDAGLVGQHLLRAQGQRDGVLATAGPASRPCCWCAATGSRPAPRPAPGRRRGSGSPRGCLSCSEQPAVWAWKRSFHDASVLRAVAVAHAPRPTATRAARYLATSSKRSLWALKKKLSRGAKSSTSRPRARHCLDVVEAVGQREGQLLHGGRAGLADVVAADRHRVPLRHVLACRTRSRRTTSRT